MLRWKQLNARYCTEQTRNADFHINQWRNECIQPCATDDMKKHMFVPPVALLLTRHYLFQFHPRNNQNQRFGVHNTSLTPPFVIEVPVPSL